VDGLVGEKTMKLANSRNGLAGHRSIHANRMLHDWEIRFLEYRLEVVASWPESARKDATLHAIVLRLATVRPLG
jgi:hypothetical protein